jgi:hypothetical protein
MATTEKIEPYIPSKLPPIKGSEQKWLEEELRKLEKTLLSLTRAVKELQAYHP